MNASHALELDADVGLDDEPMPQIRHAMFVQELYWDSSGIGNPYELVASPWADAQLQLQLQASMVGV